MSEFQNLPLPAIRDAQDYPRLIPAGQDVEIPVIGEFVYCKFSDGDVKVTINGKTTRMESGDERRSGEGTVFRGVNLKNDTAFDKSVVFVIGFGKFDRKIIQGEIVVDPRIKTANGKFVSDTRGTHFIYLGLDYKREPSITAGEGSILFSTGDFSEFPEGERGMPGFAINGDGAFYDVFYNGTNEYFIRLDSSGNVLDVESALQPPEQQFGGPTCGFRYGNTLYIGGDRFVSAYSYGRTDPLTSSDQINSFEPDGNGWDYITIDQVTGDIYGMDNNNQDIYNITQQKKLFSDETIGAARSIMAHNGAVYVISNNNYWLYYTEDSNGVWSNVRVDTSGVGLRSASGAWWTENKFEISDVDGIADELRFKEYEPFSYESGDIHYGLALESCNRIPGTYNRALTNDTSTTANVSVTWENGKAFVSGEVIKMILELIGINAGTQYMDGITAFTAEAKNQEYKINLGGRTFAADDIADNFENVEFPQTVQITALESLWSDRL